MLTDAASAEMAKLVENAYRDVNIAFANELSLISEEPAGSTSGRSSSWPTTTRGSTS